MRLLVVTQAVDKQDPVLGFFHRWLEEFAKKFDAIEVVCLCEGVHTLPDSVHVHSLGKERGRQTRIQYAVRFLRLIWNLQKDYDVVLVHMNQEYVLLGGLLWKCLGKRIYLWRNHYAGSLLTDVAVWLCTKVFCTSKHSYTARFEKTVLMPVGVDTDAFKSVPGVVCAPYSILSLGRIAPSKRLEILLEALTMLAREGIDFTADIYGAPLPEHIEYYEHLQSLVAEKQLSDKVAFRGGIKNEETPAVYSAHSIFVNTSQSGMYDKTLFEAAACGCQVLAASEDFAVLSGGSIFGTVNELAQALKKSLQTPSAGGYSNFIQHHALSALSERLVSEMKI